LPLISERQKLEYITIKLEPDEEVKVIKQEQDGEEEISWLLKPEHNYATIHWDVKVRFLPTV